MKIIAITKFNDGVALVLDRPLVYKYNKYGNSIIGQYGIFYKSYEHHHDPFAKAFAGRKFTLEMEDGEIVNCAGCWWDGLSKKAYETIGDDIINVVVCDKETLLGCYVFISAYASKSKYEALLKTYTGKKYGYYEYEAIIKNRPPRQKDICDFRKRKNHKRFNRIIYK